MSKEAVCILAIVGALSSGCAILPGACLKQEIRKEVFRITGTAAAGQTASQVVPYGTEGSQNDLTIKWEGQATPGGTQLQVFATRIECTPEKFAAGAGVGDCRSVGNRLSTNNNGVSVQWGLLVVHGRGNQDRLGPTNSYRLWIVGDRSRPATYTIASESFYGPDC